MTEKGQNIFDLAVVNYGTIEELFRLLGDNSMTVSDTPSGGLNLTVYPEFKKETFFKETEIATYVPEYSESLVSDKQSVFDLAIQNFGDLEYLFDFLEPNNLVVNTIPKSGQKLKIYNINKGNNAVKNLNLTPANLTSGIPLGGGWEYMDGSFFEFIDNTYAEFVN